MSREAFVVSVLLVASTLGCPSPRSSQAQSPAPGAPESPRQALIAVPLAVAPLTGDAVSGCAAGAAVAKVFITLKKGAAGRCVADLSPALVCMAPGGIIRWRVENDCAELRGTRDHPALRLTKPRLRYFPGPEDKLSPKQEAAAESPSIFAACEPQANALNIGRAYFYCTVRDTAHEGIYKYAVEGKEIDPLDPEVEVRRGNGG